jgi:hypothetical protein
MNARKVAMIAAVLSVGLFTLEESALAQEESAVAQSRAFNCYTIRAAAHDTWPGAGKRLDGSHYPSI